MAQQTIMTSIIRYCVRATLQVKSAVSCRRWKQIKRRTTLLRLIMEIIPIIATFISCVDNSKYLFGLPP